MLKIKFDGSFDLATGRSRREINWKNKEWTWSKLINKLSTTHRTPETHAEYMASKKSRQDEIKDIGGFVGGYLTGGRRKVGSVLHRQLITLDIDFGKGDIWDDFTLLYGSGAAVYSTHKHAPEAPRLRLIIPLDRPVMPDEYTAISRRIAGDLGIENFDHTTFQPERLMYWPSTPVDGEYVFEVQDGPFLEADGVLGRYRDWRDSSEWPVSDREGSVILRGIKKQGDPLEKPGVIGAFCRAYTISEAIETFLSDVYDPSDVEDRYTYREGSTGAGLITYDDKYAFSHHGTDPVSGKLCNAFDLVRIHKYILMDEDSEPTTGTTKLPSYKAMVDFCTRDAKTRVTLNVERLQATLEEFGETAEEDTSAEGAPASTDWLGLLEVDGHGNNLSTISNVVKILENDPRLKGRFAFDDFAKREVTLKPFPWRKVSHLTRYVTDKDLANLRGYLEECYKISAAAKVEDAIAIIMTKQTFHPVREYLDGLEWDGEERLGRLMIDYMGAADDAYTKTVTVKTFAAAVARIYQPGIKFDHVLVMIGEQGLKKSMLVDKLGGQWFSDSFTTVMGKEAFEQLQGVWLVEIAELSALKSAEVEAIKHFISKREDRYRVAYGKRTENFPRQCVFFATTNKRRFLRDPTGNRRFWPIEVHITPPVKSVSALTAPDIGQLWAEAVALYKAGEVLYLSDEMEAEARKRQTEHTEEDERFGMVEKYLEVLLPEDWDEKSLYERRAYLQGDDLQAEGKTRRQRVCAAEIYCELFGGQHRDMTAHNTRHIHDIMRKMEGWGEPKGGKLRFTLYGQQKAYVRTETDKTGGKSTASIQDPIASLGDDYLN